MTERRTHHDCPGGCGRTVSNRLFACQLCWHRLPRDLQRPIQDTARLPLVHPDRIGVVADAVQWFAGQEEDRRHGR